MDHAQGLAARRRRLRALAACVAVAALCGPAGISAAPPRVSPQEPIEEILVTGEQPGPGLWKVSQGDHVLWILGSVTPLPKKFVWRSKQVEHVIADSQLLLGEAQVHTNIGFFRGAMLLPQLIKARENEGGQTLQQVLPPDLYARWERQKQRFMGSNSGVERWRPMFAAQDLYAKALDKSGLSLRSVIWPTVTRLAKEHNVKIRRVETKLEVDDPKQMIRDFKTTPRDLDIACLAATLDRLEHDLDGMKQRAQAWATGDLETLRAGSYIDRDAACLAAATSAGSISQRYDAARAQIFEDWVSAAAASLATNRSSFGVLPMAEILQSDGRLERLRRRGYRIEAP